MISVIWALLLASAPAGAAGEGDAAFANAAPACGAKAEGVRAIAGFFELAPDQTIAEYQPDFTLTGCLAEAVRGRGRFLALVEAGNSIVQVSRRLTVQKWMKRAGERYSGVPLIAIKARKPAPAEHAGSADRILILGSAADLVADGDRGEAMLRLLRDLTRTTGLLGIVDVPDKGGVDVAKLEEAARAAGWTPAGRSTTADGLLLLKFRNG